MPRGLQNTLSQVMYHHPTMAGMSLSLAGAFLAAVIALTIEHAPTPFSVLWLLVFQNAFSLVVAFVIAHSQSHLRSITASFYKMFWVHLIRALFGISIYAAYYNSLQLISALESSLLLNTAPLFVPVLSLLIYKKRFSWQLLQGSLIGFLGLFLVLQPSFTGIQGAYGYFLALFSGVSFALTLLFVRQLKKVESASGIIIHYSLICLILSALYLVWHPVPLSLESLRLCLFLSFLFCLKQYCITWSLAFIRSSTAGLLNYSSLLMILSVDLFLHQGFPNVYVLFGTAFIVGGVFINIVSPRFFSKKKKA